MKHTFIITTLLCLTSSIWAQNLYDDVYYNPADAQDSYTSSTSKSYTKVSTKPVKFSYTSSNETRDIDEYNRFYNYATSNDNATQPTGTASDGDYKYTSQIVKYYNPDAVSDSQKVIIQNINNYYYTNDNGYDNCNNCNCNGYYYNSKCHCRNGRCNCGRCYASSININIGPTWWWNRWYDPWFRPYPWRPWDPWDPWRPWRPIPYPVYPVYPYPGGHSGHVRESAGGYKVGSTRSTQRTIYYGGGSPSYIGRHSGGHSGNNYSSGHTRGSYNPNSGGTNTIGGTRSGSNSTHNYGSGSNHSGGHSSGGGNSFSGGNTRGGGSSFSSGGGRMGGGGFSGGGRR